MPKITKAYGPTYEARDLEGEFRTALEAQTPEEPARVTHDDVVAELERREPEEPDASEDDAPDAPAKDAEPDADAPEVDPPTDYTVLTVTQLQDELKRRDLSTIGLKADLVARLEEDDRA